MLRHALVNPGNQHAVNHAECTTRASPHTSSQDVCPSSAMGHQGLGAKSDADDRTRQDHADRSGLYLEASESPGPPRDRWQEAMSPADFRQAAGLSAESIFQGAAGSVMLAPVSRQSCEGPLPKQPINITDEANYQQAERGSGCWGRWAHRDGSHQACRYRRRLQRRATAIQEVSCIPY